MVSKAFTIPFHAVILFFVIIDILHIGFDILLDLPAEFLTGIVLDCIQQVSNTKGCQEFSVLHFQYMRHLVHPLVFEIVVALVTSCSQRQALTPCRVDRHQLTDLIHCVLTLGCLDDDFIVNMSHNVQPLC